uniref:ATP synthase F0 subunit 6 n=1 Tax=Trachonurus sulcatus TaxID=630746 RepID=UPI0028D3B14F|nr:ATP synthase F0 subunit 6 [Trachonurus sulcatus]WMY89751.1 ATP synthase F0 subunit 6 [Trachonurus sulcatus]
MMTSLFSQFASPYLLGIPLVILAIGLPCLLLPTPSGRWLENRTMVLFGHFITRFTSQLFLPLNLNGHKWAPLFVALVILLLSINTLGLLPYTFTPTAQLSLNLGLAIPLWLSTVLTGLRNQPTHTFGHFLPEGSPTLLIPLLVVIESISLLIRPVALGVRLTANLTAGHLLIHLVSSAVFSLLPSALSVAMLAAALLFLLTLLEAAVAVIQAYVFVLLLSLYLQENI